MIRLSGSFDLLPQHRFITEFAPDQHENEVYDEIIDSIYNMNPDAKSNLIK